MRMRKLTTLLAVFTLAAPLMFYGCSGDDGAAGLPGKDGTPGQDVSAPIAPESCVVCHGTSGAQHQASYDQLYQDNVIFVDNVVYSFVNDNTDVVTFHIIKKAGLNASTTDFDCTKLQNWNVYFAQYNDNGTFGFEPVINSQSLKGTRVNSGSGICTVTKASLDNVDLSTKNGLILVYGYDEGTGGAYTSNRVQQAKYPYAGYLKLNTVDYVSAANVAGCEKCHMTPYVKHGNILGRINHDDATSFYTCKACHLDNRPGSDFIWQILVDDPAAAAVLEAAKVGNEIEYTPAQELKYAYKTRLMNDVHMSHAMEFEYPQSMANCATCHAGKLDRVLTDNNFTVETCKSCHPVTDADGLSEKPQPALADIVPHTLVGRDNCYNCHGAAGNTPFNQIHTGYDKKIYGTDNGVKYSSSIVVTIDNASFVDNTSKLTIQFSATGSLGGLSATAIKPTVLVGLYGWDTKDFIVDPHSRIGGERTLEYIVGSTTNPRFTTDNTTPAGSWKVTADLSMWAASIADGSIKRAEIAVMPSLQDPALPKSPTGDNVVALDAPSRTFVLGSKVLQAPVADSANIVKVTGGCNNCHDALGTSFHSGDRGGNIVVCRLCHNTRTGSSHLEMQSRSIDSYVHSIHSFQALDADGYDHNDAVEEMFYKLKTEANFPTFGINDCEACHNAGKFNVPDQSKSLPGLHTASDDNVVKWNRNIFGVPAYITGPASRACGGCHRAELIKEDEAVELAAFNQHTRTNGYLVEASTTTLDTVISKIMANFYAEDFFVSP